MAPRTIRDLLSGTPVNNPTLQELAQENPPLDAATLRSGVEDRMASRVPGDSEAPIYGEWENNPYKGQNPLTVLRKLREGQIESQAERRQAVEWLRVYAKLSGDRIPGV